jgi:hypothetical protein
MQRFISAGDRAISDLIAVRKMAERGEGAFR